MDKVKPKKGGEIFQNRFLELLTKTHPLVIIAMYVPLSLLSLYYHYTQFSGVVAGTLGLFAVGVLSWTLAEYLLHRYAFHYINDSHWVQKVHYAVHGVHHDYPTDKKRLIMPPVPSLLLVSLFFLIFWLLMGTAVFAFLPGFIIGYLAYAMVHYSIHAFQPPFDFLKPLWRHHHVHHHVHSEKAFGVSSPLWDYIFGTMPPKLRK